MLTPRLMDVALIALSTSSVEGRGVQASNPIARSRWPVPIRAGHGAGSSAAARAGSGARRGRGSLSGLALYAGTHGSVLPALGMQPPPWGLAPATVAWESTSHLVFGAALEAARSGLERTR